MRILLIALVLAFPYVSANGQSWEAAIRGQQQVITLFLTDLQESFAFLAEEEQQTYIARYRYNLDMHRGFCYQFSDRYPELAGDALNLTLATKGMILQTGREMRRTILQSGDTAAISLFNEWTELKDKLADQYSLPEQKRLQGLPKMEKRAIQYEKDLYRIAASYNGLPDLLGVRWEDVRAALPDQHVAVEFSHFRYFDGEHWTDSLLYVAFVLRRDMPWPVMVRLGEEKEISSILLAKKDQPTIDRVNYLYGFPEPDMDDPDDMAGQRLYALIWKKIEPFLQPGDTIHVAPSGWLHLLNPSAIPFDYDHVLADRYTFEWTSTTGLLATASDSTAAVVAGKLLLFGGINYEQKATAAAIGICNGALPETMMEPGVSRGANWKYLPGTRAEVNAIAEMAANKALDVQVFKDEMATEEAFNALSGNVEGAIIHIATHGFFLENQREEPADNAFTVAENPLLRSGLLMAGAAPSWRGEQTTEGKDGILTALDIANSDLTGVPLVVLSACNTGMGTMDDGEGLYGLQRAFRMAGTDYLLMTLWEVPDAQTARFMQELYSHLLETNDVQRAFTTARELIRSNYPAPYYWGAFVLTR